MQPVVVVPELLDQHPPPCRVQQVLEEAGQSRDNSKQTPSLFPADEDEHHPDQPRAGARRAASISTHSQATAASLSGTPTPSEPMLMPWSVCPFCARDKSRTQGWMESHSWSGLQNLLLRALRFARRSLMPGNSLLEQRIKSDSCWSLKPPSFRLRRGGVAGREGGGSQARVRSEVL